MVVTEAYKLGVDNPNISKVKGLAAREI